jgi:hypothetical protein
MSLSKPTKINKLLKEWPKGTVATSRWLEKQGVRFDLAERYRRTGWLRSVGKGAAVREGDKVGWQGAVFALQSQLGLSVHPGGKTALSMKGKSHFLPTGTTQKIALFLSAGEKLPKWFLQNDWNVHLQVITTNLFSSTVTGLAVIPTGEFSLKVSSAERAIMEVLHFVPAKVTFDEAKLLFEGLITLRPKVVSELLCLCTSVKVKRLFMVLADLNNHPWVSKVDLSDVDLGKGKRSLVSGGYFHSRYNITVPMNWKPSDESENERL